MQQANALEVLKTGANVFLTGEAGSGKTYVLNQYIDWAKESGLSVAVTASTGIAATHLNGRTIHSWSGIGIKDMMDEKTLSYLENNDDLVDRVRGTDILVIDEVSMLSHRQLDLVNQVLQTLRETPAPFGGMQIILSGDFFQLPPIGKESRLVVAADAWSKASFAVCYLESQHRSDDSSLSELLAAIRSGEVDQMHFEWLIERQVKSEEVPEGVTQLYTHNKDVDRINLEELKKLKTDSKTYTAKHTGDAGAAEALVRNSLITHKLKLKVGAEVMFIKNDPEGKYVNGSRGKVVSVTGSHPRVQLYSSDKELAVTPDAWSVDGTSAGGDTTDRQLPLRLAWAVTVHKSQGMTLDQAAIDLSNTFVAGQGYVALSRLQNLAGLFLLGINNQAMAINPDIIELDKELHKQSDFIVSHLESHAKEDLVEKQKQFVTRRGGSWKPE